jgi:uncharacterized protein YqjF (DUF2071 family)
MMQAKKPIFMQARWENLVMINYEVDANILMPYLPAYTELDRFNNKVLVSVVGFMFTNTKVFGLRWPFHVNFEEVNLRFYVKHFDGTVDKRGVVFISEIVPSPVISFFANALYHEHYTARPMSHKTVVQNDQLSINYNWKHNRKWNNIEVMADASLKNIDKGSEEEFILEHYWGYNKYNAHTTVEYEVEHVTWQIHNINKWQIQCDVASLYGKEFIAPLSATPSSVFLAKGSDIIIRKPSFIRSQP